MKIAETPLRCPCDAAHFTDVWAYDTPPEGEICFQFSSSETYRREIKRCRLCGHFVSVHEMDDSTLYSGDYVSANYGDDGIKSAFERINSLDPSKSDNVGRVGRVLAFAREHFKHSSIIDRVPSILDIGSGLCVFLHRMKAAGWDCTALDPDPRAAAHARETVGVPAICGDFMSVENIGQFDVIAFNKVLEHVKDPVAMLGKSAQHLHAGGFVYIELPDGEMAAQDGRGRQEFFIDHHHIFSSASVDLLAVHAGFAIRSMERLREPSSKYTLRAFLNLP